MCHYVIVYKIYYNMKKNKKHKMKFKYKFLISMIIIFILAFVYLINIVNPIIFNYNKAIVEHNSIDLLNNSIESSLSNYLYEDLVSIQKNDSGDITLISCNSANVNKLANSITIKCQTDLKSLENTGIKVALLTFTGLPFLNGIGPKINIKTTPVGYCDSKYVSKFTACGINQTLHQLSIVVTAKVDVLLPVKTFEVEVNTEVLVCESVIVGKIPQVYLNTGIIGNNMNLTP